MTETTEINESTGFAPWESDRGAKTQFSSGRVRGWILYDGHCRFCVQAAKAFAGMFCRRNFEMLPLQTSWVQQRLALAKDMPPGEMRVLTSGGRDFGGAAAVIFLASQIWWLWPLYGLAQISGIARLLDRGYRWISAHRGCGVPPSLKCATKPRCGDLRRSPPLSWAWSASLLPLIAVLLGRRIVAPWVFMWLMAGALFLGAKWLTFLRAQQPRLNLVRTFAYFFLWPGMDALNFLGRKQTAAATSVYRFDQCRTAKVLFAFAKIFFGVAILFGFARITLPGSLQGWIGMIGIALILHFGIFDLASIAWNGAGVNAKPIMNAPIKSVSLTEFWGRRWNSAFNQLVLGLFFHRLARRFGANCATLGSFLFSGLLHELVISLPAAGGYGLPTGYFLLQGAGAIAQRKWDLRHGFRGWIFTMSAVVAPAFWLFHPLFVRRVILPFMQAIGAL